MRAGTRFIKVVLDPYNPIGTATHVNINASKTDRWGIDARGCYLARSSSTATGKPNSAAEAYPCAAAYVKNHSLGFEVLYRWTSGTSAYRLDFIVLVVDGKGVDDLLHLIVEIKGDRR